MGFVLVRSHISMGRRRQSICVGAFVCNEQRMECALVWLSQQIKMCQCVTVLRHTPAQ